MSNHLLTNEDRIVDLLEAILDELRELREALTTGSFVVNEEEVTTDNKSHSGDKQG